MPAPVLSTEQWAEVEKAYILGVSAPELAKQFGVEENAIYQRANRYSWPSPSRLSKAKEEYKLSQRTEEGVSECKESLKATEIVAENIAEYGQQGQLAVLRGLLPLIKRTFREESALLTKEITTWKDASSAFSIFSKASGLDKPQIAIQTNVWGGDWGQQAAIPADAETDDAP